MQKQEQILEEQDGFEDPSNLTKWTKCFLYAWIAIIIVSLISHISMYQFLSDVGRGVYLSKDAALAAAEPIDFRQNIISIIYTVVLVASAIQMLRWTYMANYNARKLGATEMVFTPFWSVAWYFMPIFNLWKPYQVMKEIWKASSNPQSWQSQSVSPLLYVWYFLFILIFILGIGSFHGVVKVAGEIVKSIAVEIVLIPFVFVIIAIINRVHEMQMSHAKVKHLIQVG